MNKPAISSVRRSLLEYNFCHGIYCIKNLTNSKRYIGKTTNLKRRLEKHISNLRAGKHQIKRIQDDFNKGHKFMFSVIEFFTPENVKYMNLKEIQYTVLYKSHKNEKGYNSNVGIFREWDDESILNYGDGCSLEKTNEVDIAIIDNENIKFLNNDYLIDNDKIFKRTKGTNIKIFIDKIGKTISEITTILNEKYDSQDTPVSLSRQIREGTIPYWKVLRIADVLGYKIRWDKEENK